MWRHGLDSSGSGLEQVAGTCECCNELSSSINAGNLLVENRLASQEGLCSTEWVSKQVGKGKIPTN
jgi:hypothetical protein